MSLTDQDLDKIEERFTKSLGALGVDTDDPQAQRTDFVFLRGARRLWVLILGAVAVGIAAAYAAPLMLFKP